MSEPPPAGTDQVPRLKEILRAHPGVTYLGPRESGTGMHEATWTRRQALLRAGVVVTVRHEHLTYLCDDLEDMLGPGLPS